MHVVRAARPLQLYFSSTLIIAIFSANFYTIAVAAAVARTIKTKNCIFEISRKFVIRGRCDATVRAARGAFNRWLLWWPKYRVI